MKFARYIVVIFVLLLIAALGVHLYRDTIARKVANRALRDYDISVVDVAVQSIGAEQLEFAELVLAQSDGSVIRIEGISLPVKIGSPRPSELAVATVSLEQSDREKPPPALAILLQTFLDTPTAIANTTVSVEKLSIPGVATISDVLWQSGDTGQKLHMTIDPFDVSIEVAERTDDGYYATVDIATRDGRSASSMDLYIERQNEGLVVEGSTRIELAPWLPVYHVLGVVPPEVIVLDATLEGAVNAEVFDDASRENNVRTLLSPVEGIRAEYQAGDAPAVHVRAETPTPIQAGFEYPSLQWSAAIASADLQVTTDSLSNLPVNVADVQCVGGITCTATASVSATPLLIAGWEIESVSAITPLSLSTGDSTRITLSDSSELSLSILEQGSNTIESVSLTSISKAIVVVDELGWHLDVENLSADVGDFRTNAGVSSSFPIDIQLLSIANNASEVSGHYSIEPGAMTLDFDGTGIHAPAASGEFNVRDDEVVSSHSLSTPNEELQANLEIVHNLDSQIGTLTINESHLRFDDRTASEYVLDWAHPWDVVGGSVAVDGELEWNLATEPAVYSAALHYDVRNLAASDKESAFAGLNAKSTLVLDKDGGISMPETDVMLQLLDMGVQITDIAAAVTLVDAKPSIDVSALSMSLLGGDISTEPFLLSPADTTEIVFNVRSVQLQFIAGLLNFNKLAMDGSVSGRLPLEVGADRISMDGGRLVSDPPGGFIQYGAGGSDISAVDSPLALVSTALANFQFESLSSDVSYSEQGDLVLAMRLEGVNPDMDETQPVILNLNVENNVPQMLKSLKATRSIEDILETKVAN